MAYPRDPSALRNSVLATSGFHARVASRIASPVSRRVAAAGVRCHPLVLNCVTENCEGLRPYAEVWTRLMYTSFLEKIIQKS